MCAILLKKKKPRFMWQEKLKMKFILFVRYIMKHLSKIWLALVAAMGLVGHLLLH